MQYIANIITKNKLDISLFFNVTDNYNNIDTSLPTLIIGWGEVKKLFPEQDILNNKITDTISWTFSKREKRHQYEKDINTFIQSVIMKLDKIIGYKFFNYLLSNEEKKKSFISYINTKNNSIYYNSKFMYVYIPDEKMTLGISLQDLEYNHINTKDFINSISKRSKIVCSNLNCIDTQSLPLIKDNVKVIAYLNYLKYCDIYKEKY